MTDEAFKQEREDAEDLGAADRPYLVVHARMAPEFRVHDIQGTFKETFRAPPQIRASGFNLGGCDGVVEVLRGGGLRKTVRAQISLSALPTGLSTLIASDDVLSHGMENRSSGGELINPRALVELVYEFCRFVANHVRGPSADAPFSVQAQLRRLDVAGARRLVAGPLGGHSHMFGGGALPAGDASEVITESVSGASPEHAAFELLADIYRQYGLREAAVPYADTVDRTISEDKLLNNGSN